MGQASLQWSQVLVLLIVDSTGEARLAIVDLEGGVRKET